MGGGIGGTSKLGGDERVGEGYPFLGERVGGGTTFSAREKESIYVYLEHFWVLIGL
jgi:hypothetical protein